MVYGANHCAGQLGEIAPRRHKTSVLSKRVGMMRWYQEAGPVADGAPKVLVLGQAQVRGPQGVQGHHRAVLLRRRRSQRLQHPVEGAIRGM